MRDIRSEFCKSQTPGKLTFKDRLTRLEERVVDTLAKSTAKHSATRAALRRAHADRTGVPGLALLDCKGPQFRLPCDLLVKIFPKQTNVATVFHKFNRTPICDAWIESIDTIPDWGPDGYKAIAFRAKGWGVSVVHDLGHVVADLAAPFSATVHVQTKFGQLYIDSLETFAKALNWRPDCCIY